MKDNTLKSVLRKIRTFGTFYVAKQTSNHLEAIRFYEVGVVQDFLPPEGRFLEIGAGTGWQAQVMQNAGYDISAIDIPSSNLKNNRVWPVTDYDGKVIPFPDNTFDIIYSSNVLEHIAHIHEFQKEIQRVLKSTGIAVHVLPTSRWRYWSSITEIIKSWRFPVVHGEQAKNVITEMYYFSRCWWQRLFLETGWAVEIVKPIGLFYTGSSLMDSRLSIKTRLMLSVVMGSACDIYILRKNKT